MNDTISIRQFNSLRSEFKTYLRESNPGYAESSILTLLSDAFFALNNNVGVDFWASLVNEESIYRTRDRIRDYFIEKRYDNPDQRANNYLTAMRRLKSFLDSKHPNIARDWSGKSISYANLRSDFLTWMKKLRKKNGEFYSPNTINQYTSALKNATKKLGLDDSVNTDLFFYSTIDEFEAAYNVILSSPNFKEVDLASGNNAYSNGMALYAEFLKELGEPSAWVFQGNPKYYDVIGAVENNDIISWNTNQYARQMKKGDKVYIWISGVDSGIVAAGVLNSFPEMRILDTNDPYSREEFLKGEESLAVYIRIERKFTAPEKRVLRSVLLADERTKQMEILTFPGATNYRVTKTQDEVIESIINGNYRRLPAMDALKAEVVSKRRYWLYAPGEQARLWDEFYSSGIMGIGWDDLGDLTQYQSKTDIKLKMKQVYDKTKSYINDGLAVWQFAQEIAIGDVIIVKRGMSMIIGRGIVESNYIFDKSRAEYLSVRKVRWTHKGEWEHPGQAVVKTLTEITQYTEYVERLEFLVNGENSLLDIDNDIEIEYPDYTEIDFLREVYLSEKQYDTLKGLLLRKKNVIIQGAPGVGKTFSAQRLAFSIMGEKDTSRVKTIQFHQSYSYEDFVMGYRPDGTGFHLAEGPFYKFCKTAEGDDERPYFFIIDEINRGNLSKIFGELLMLIEGDKRGEKYAMRLLYKDEQFSVPENVYIIGMMNTADRSLAMIDYALRRRFAFFDMEPAFSSEGFKIRQATVQNSKYDVLISTVESLNKAIAEDVSLGIGFRIGHSYFCTNEIIDDDWLSSMIEYELIPLLNEYWFDEPSKVESWASRLRSALNG